MPKSLSKLKNIAIKRQLALLKLTHVFHQEMYKLNKFDFNICINLISLILISGSNFQFIPSVEFLEYFQFFLY